PATGRPTISSARLAAATSGRPGTNPRLVRCMSSRPPISPSPCSAGYLGRSRQIRSATPPSFLLGERQVFLSRCARRRASELLKLLLSRRVFPLSPTIVGASDELGSCRRQLERVEGNWNAFKGKLQQKWGKLTDDDVNVIESNRTELTG